LVRNGRIGKLKHITVGLPTGPKAGPFPVKPVPAWLDWDFYQGQAPVRDYVEERTHGNFRWWYEYSGGNMTDWGAHHFDIAQWGNGTERTGPIEVEGKSLVEMIPGGYAAASEYQVDYTYENGVTMTALDGKRAPNGIKFEGDNGWIFVSREKIDASKPEILEEKLPEGAIRLYLSSDHMANLFDCIRQKKTPICDVEIGHRSISVAHIGVISMRLNRKLKWNPVKEEFVNDDEANTWVTREMRKPYDFGMI
jgi:predicted dehydrogenase